MSAASEMRLELLELADALEALNRWWPLPSTRRWAKRLVNRTRQRHEAAWREESTQALVESVKRGTVGDLVAVDDAERALAAYDAGKGPK